MLDGELATLVAMIDKRRNFTLIDIGAMGGIPRKWKPLQGLIDIVAFEPDPREFEKLDNSRGVRYFNYFLNEKPGPVSLFIAKESGKSSQLRPDMELLSQFEDAQRFQIIKEEAVPAARVTTLDKFLEDQAIPDVDFIKLDTQGSELPILRGGQKTVMSKAFGLQVEVEFSALYRQQPLFRDVDGFLSAQGFQLIDLKRHYWKRKEYHQYRGKGQLIFADALYFKDISSFCNELSCEEDPSARKSKIVKAVLTCLIYGIFDYAISLTTKSAAQGHLDADTKDRVISIIKQSAQEGFSPSLHLGKFYNTLLSLLQRFSPPSKPGWADSDRDIGNTRDL